jgi:uncharacterized protein (TIGR02147 family)
MEESTEFFKIVLNDEFIKRQKKNPKFSIRAFAKNLDVNSSTLTQILNGKRKLTENMTQELGKKLRFSSTKMRLIKNGKLSGRAPYKSFKKMEEDEFEVISEWYYGAILELTRCDSFRGNALWIAKVLDLPHAQTVDAIERLKRLNYLEITHQGKWIDRLGDVNNLGNERKAKAFTENQRQIVKKALEALDKTPYEHRVQSSITVAVSKARALEAKSMILDFLEELDVFLKSGETTDEVYNLSVSLYPISDTTGEIHG